MKGQRDVQSVDRFWEPVDQKLLDGVVATETFMYLKLAKQTYAWGTR